MDCTRQYFEDSERTVRAVCFTGHRDIPYGDAIRLPALLETVIAELCERGAITFRTGGAMGFDTLAALKVLDMKEKYPQIRLELILPCRNQTERWDEPSRKTYQYILERSDGHRFLFDAYVDGCMLERNRCLVEGSDVCVAYCARSRGGTAFTVTRALRAGLEVINLYDRL